jgi:galactokinase
VSPDFAAIFEGEPAAAAEAPGRVNLIGEHTDYNGGFVLPTAIPQRTRVQIRPRADTRVRVASSAIGGGAVESYGRGAEARRSSWIDYVQGVTWAWAEAGHGASGFDALVDSDVPLGSGLSSSASLEVALLRALALAAGVDLGAMEIARLAHRAESGFVGAPVGLMDPIACSLAKPGEALFVDTRSLETRRIALPPAVEVVVVDSGVAHDHASGDYRVRRAECEAAARALGVAELRDVVDVAALDRLDALLARRARHVVTENARVLAAVDALDRSDPSRLGELLRASHASMRDDFAVSIPEVDHLVALADADPATFGARLTGGGFGGAIVALVRAGEGARVGREVVAQHEGWGRGAARLLVPAGEM